jgi:hypothetical protein
LAARKLPARNLKERSIIGGDLNLLQADWKGDAEKASRFEMIVNNFVWDNSYSQVECGLTRGDVLWDIHLLRPESSFTYCNISPGIIEHNGVLLEVEWGEICREPKVERTVPVYYKTDMLGLQALLRENLNLWAEIGSCVKEIRKSYKDIIFEGMKRYVPKKIRVNFRTLNNIIRK